MWDGGFQDYVHDWWNLMDFVMNSLYLATISLKIVAYTKVRRFPGVEAEGLGLIPAPCLLSCAVLRQQTQEPVGDVAPDSGGRGRVCHRQHLQLAAPHLAVHGQLPPGAAADLSGEDAAGHPQVPLHLLSGKPSCSPGSNRKSGSNLDSDLFIWHAPQVLLAFANGLNQLYFYYETKAEKGKCKGIRCVEQNNAFST